MTSTLPITVQASQQLLAEYFNQAIDALESRLLELFTNPEQAKEVADSVVLSASLHAELLVEKDQIALAAFLMDADTVLNWMISRAERMRGSTDSTAIEHLPKNAFPDAFVTRYLELQSDLEPFLCRLLGNSHDAQIVAADVLQTLEKRLLDLSREGNAKVSDFINDRDQVRRWTFGVARRMSRCHHRRIAFVNQHLEKLGELREMIGRELASNSVSHEQEVDNVDEVAFHMSRLSPREREIVEAKVNGLKLEAIGQAFGLHGTVICKRLKKIHFDAKRRDMFRHCR